MRTATHYAGGKNGCGVYQRLINMMPPHEVYIEAFLGSGAVMRRKRPAGRNLGIDIDPEVIAMHGSPDRFDLLCENAVDFLHRFAAVSSAKISTLIYVDPPYLGRLRRNSRAIYRYEMLHDAAQLRIVPAMVMVSGYPGSLYDSALYDWRRVSFSQRTRGLTVTEVVWMNYPEPTELHDYQFLGEDFHDRCRIARKIKRLRSKLAALPALERAAVIAGIGHGL